MARRWWKWLLLVVCVPLLYDRTEMADWVGSTDLEVAFAVTEADSGKPIPNARVEIHMEFGSYEGRREERDFVLVTNADGVAQKECRNNMCTGMQSGLRFTDTYSVDVPGWHLRVTALGFEPSERVWLYESKWIRQVQRVDPHRNKLMVPVSLTKNRD